MLIESVMPSNRLILCLLQWVSSLHQVAKGLELQHQSTMNIQGWLPSGLIGLTTSYTKKKENSTVHDLLSSLHNIMNITSLWPTIFDSTSNIEENVTWHFTRSSEQTNCFYTWIMTIRFIKLDKNSIYSEFLKNFQNCYLSWVLKKKDLSIKIPAKELICLQ